MIDVTYVDHMGSDLTVVNAARVSFGKQSDWLPRVHNGEAKVLSQRDIKLIKYLAKHKHISPFGHCFASFHVKAPVFVARQLVKHKFLRWNEISRRYVNSTPEFYVPDAWREASDDKKQGSGDALDLNPDLAKNMVESSLQDYQYLLAKGVCPEQARMILPQSMMTEWYWSGSLDAFVDMCNLRCKPDTQAETREVAELIDDQMTTMFPYSWEELRNG
jgi:thymidylate synthase (FAD)